MSIFPSSHLDYVKRITNLSWVGNRKCGTFLSSLDRDPHPTCPRCRGKICTRDLTCDFCIDWSPAHWELFAKKRAYKDRKKSRPSGSAPLAPCPGTSSEVPQPGTSSSCSSRPSGGQDERVGGSQGAPCVVSREASSPPLSFRSVLALIRNFHNMEEPAGVPSARCKTSLASIHGLMSETSPAFHLLTSPLMRLLLDDTNLALSKFLEDQTVHGFLPVPGRRHQRYYCTSSSSFPGLYSVPPGVTSITLEKASESRKRTVSLSASQVSSMETMLSGVCEVASWLDWWLSTCGGFREHLPVEVRADFERLMLSGSRALEFLASQGSTALGNLVLSRRDSLLANVRSTVPAEEVARLRYSPLPETVSVFPSPLLHSALAKMLAAANDALVQRTLHPPRILRKAAVAGGSAGSSTAGSAPLGPIPFRSRHRLLPLLARLARRGRTARVSLPFPLPLPLEALAALGEKAKEPERSRPDGTTLPLRVGGLPGSALEAVAGNRSGVLGGDRSLGRLLCPLPGFSSSPISHPGIVSDVPGRLSSVSSLAARDRGDACQRSLRNRPRSGSWLSQSSFPGGEGFWRLETRDRSLSLERVHPADSVQYGNSRFCTVICQRGGFSSFLGSERCVLSDPDPSIF